MNYTEKLEKIDPTVLIRARANQVMIIRTTQEPPPRNQINHHHPMLRNETMQTLRRTQLNATPNNQKTIVETYIKVIRPLCKSGVITLEQYQWAVGKTTEKVMKYHSKERNANFLIKEGEKVKKHAQQYVEASQQKTKP